jgi:carbon-monoxide dehydrogenase large subunit
MNDTNAHSHARHPRVEDDPLVRGLGRYADDIDRQGKAFAAFVRSPHACARIRSIDTEAARAAPGVIAVLTGADTAGLGNIGRHPPLNGRGGKPLIMPLRPALVAERATHAGEPVAMVVAETVLAALDAAELVEVDYEILPAVIDLCEATRPGAPQLWPDAPGNLALDWPGPAADPEANTREVERIIASAKHVARVGVTNQRILVNSMEARGATASYDATIDTYTLRACSQSAGALRDNVLGVMNIPKERLRVLTDDVGGAFGLKTGAYPEYIAMMVGARKLGRPIHWMSTRSEAFLSDAHARDTFTEAELALDEHSKFLALRVRHFAAMGSYIGAVGANIQTLNFARCLPGMYDIKHVDVGVHCIFTNTVPTAPYRGAGRPEANYALERVVEEAARLTGIDPAELRRRNLIPGSAMPYKTPLGTTYDSGDFKPLVDKALALADYTGFEQRRAEARTRRKYRGIGISCMLEHAGGAPLEGVYLTFPGGDTLGLNLNVQNTGQGHASVFARLIAERLGIPADKIHHKHGDSALEIAGMASVGSRSAMTVSHSLLKAIDLMLAKGKTVAAHMLEAAEADIAYRDGRFEVVGTDRRVSLFEVATRAAELARKGEIPESLDTKTTTETPLTFPNGCHIAEVEIDPDTGHMAMVAYTAVDDCGNALDHVIVEGQVHGSVAQGLGAAAMEHAIYDGSGQLVTGSFMDYAMPHADDMPALREALHPVPAKTNPLGVKGAGEAGTTAAIAAVMNAVADAIPGGVATKLEMPATPEKLWQACRQAPVPSDFPAAYEDAASA